MNRNYFFLTAMMLLLAAGTMFLTKSKQHKQIDPDKLLWEIIQPTRYLSTDQIAKMIIQKDPTLEIIDVRSAEEFNKYTLTNAINLPLDSLLNNESLNYLGIPGVNVVFISNDDIYADQAWVIAKRLGFSSTYVMKGGLNRWIETIIQPQEPDESASQEAFANYDFRKGARMYFTGAKIEKSTTKKEITIKRRKKSNVASGGC